MCIRSKKGFTLIELIIVIAILGIIALIAVPNLSGLLQRSRVNTDKRSAEAIGRAIRIWQTDIDAGSREIPTGKPVLYSSETGMPGLCPDYIKSTYTAKSYPGGEGRFFVTSVAGGVNNSEQKICIAIDEVKGGAGADKDEPKNITAAPATVPAVLYDSTPAGHASGLGDTIVAGYAFTE